THQTALHPFPTRRSSDLGGKSAFTPEQMISNNRFPITNPPKDELTFSLPLVSASRLNPSMSLASLRLHSPCPPLDGLAVARRIRSEEHTSELQSPDHIVC